MLCRWRLLLCVLDCRTMYSAVQCSAVRLVTLSRGCHSYHVCINYCWCNRFIACYFFYICHRIPPPLTRRHPVPSSLKATQYRWKTATVRCQVFRLLFLLLPLALQPAVGFGLSNNTSPFFPIYHQLSPSSHSQHLKISFYSLLNSIHSTSRAGRLLAITKIYT